MNKEQELLERISSQQPIVTVRDRKFDGLKPVVPQFVADFYESIKDDFEYKVYELCLQYKHRVDELPQGVAWWFGDSRNKPIETLVMMHNFGYEVKKEKLYTVEIPNPNSADSNVDAINIDFDVDDIPVRLKIKLTVRGYEAEWKE